MNISREDRKEIISKLRLHLPDELIGDLFGITRERVAQIGGRRRVNGLVRNDRREHESAIKDYASKGYSVRETQIELAKQDIEVPYSTVSFIFRLFGYGAWGSRRSKLRRQRKLEEIKGKVTEFIRDGRAFNMWEISKWNYNLHAQMQRILPYPNSKDPPGKQWAKYMGVKWDGYEIVDGKKKYT